MVHAIQAWTYHLYVKLIATDSLIHKHINHRICSYCDRQFSERIAYVTLYRNMMDANDDYYYLPVSHINTCMNRLKMKLLEHIPTTAFFFK